MQPFLRFLIVSCLVLVTWWRLETDQNEQQFVSIAVLGLAGMTALLVCKRRRAGLWLSMLLGMGHLAGTLLTVGLGQIPLVLPIVGWCFLVIVSSVTLLVATRERHPRRATYERHPEY